MANPTIDGYLGGELYPSGFHRQFTPSWIDAMLRRRGLAPPRRADRAPFALLDLGCGDGLALVALAAAHPEGRFVGIDALPAHIERATASAGYAGVDNVAFFTARFAEIDDPAEPVFDYVTAQGVLAWISPDNRAHVRRLCANQLKPGGAACIGYNCMPGWSDGLAVQQLLTMFAEGEEGSGRQRFAAALERVRAIAAAGAPDAVARFLAWLDGLAGTLPPDYFTHEYLNRDWQPLWSGREHAAMAEHGLAYAGPARAEVLRPDLILNAAEQAELARLPDGPARETALDVMLNQSFRIDLFGRGLGRAAEARLADWWAAAVSPDEADFEFVAQAGAVAFDGAAARGVLTALADGPRPLSAVAGVIAAPEDVLVRAVDALWMSGQVLPCEPPADPPAADHFNRLNAAAARGGLPLPALVGRHGALPVAAATIAECGGGDAAAGAALARLGIAPL